MIENFQLGDLFQYKFDITQELVDKFVSLSNDKNPLHIDDEFAKEKGFKSKVVQGNLQNCFISYFIGMCLPSKHVMILSQTINYKNPVFINDNIHLTSKIVGIFSSVGVIEFKYKFKNQSDQIISTGKINIKLIT